VQSIVAADCILGDTFNQMQLALRKIPMKTPRTHLERRKLHPIAYQSCNSKIGSRPLDQHFTNDHWHNRKGRN